MYLNWSMPIYYSSKLIGSYGEKDGDYSSIHNNFDYLSLYESQLFSSYMDKPAVYFQEKYEQLIKFDCLWLLGEQVLVSKRLKILLESLTLSTLEFIEPSIIQTKDQQILKDYYIINLLDKVSAIDSNNSIPVYSEDNHFLYYSKRQFKQSTEKRLLAREVMSNEIIITHDVADELLKANMNVCKCFGFYSVNPLTEYKTKRK